MIDDSMQVFDGSIFVMIEIGLQHFDSSEVVGSNEDLSSNVQK